MKTKFIENNLKTAEEDVDLFILKNFSITMMNGKTIMEVSNSAKF